jgi:phosphatidylserine/phosphatidylglycerophosphate/cardiolipin synthase-like enzyme
MTVLYVPVFKVAVSYSVNVGRRWSIIEHLLLAEVARQKRGIADLAVDANLPRRLVVEALINLLRAGWVEVLATADGSVFNATDAGARRANEEELPAQLHRDVRWISLCVDRITGSWFRSEDLQLVYQPDLPDEAEKLPEKYDTIDPRELPRELLYLRADEALEPSEPGLRTPSRPFAQVRVEADGIKGLPAYAPLDLIETIERAAHQEAPPDTNAVQSRANFLEGSVEDTIATEDLIVGGGKHLALLKEALQLAKTTVVIHSCFVHPDAIEKLLADFEAAASRGVRVELLWGLYNDPESNEKQRAISDSEKILEKLSPRAKGKVNISSISSRSHSKVLLYDLPKEPHWEMVVGSCNFLSSWFDLTEVSVRLHNPSLIGSILSRLIATQQPASGAWPPMTIRLSRTWSAIRRQKWEAQGDSGAHAVRIVADREHYTCVTQMRDEAIRAGAGTKVFVGCDLYGAAAESSVMTPMARAAECGCVVTVSYRRPSKYLRDEGLKPEPGMAEKRGIRLQVANALHGKFILVGDDILAVSSFNWLSTSVEGTRTRSAELGLLIRGNGLASVLYEKLKALDVLGETSSEPVTLELFPK